MCKTQAVILISCICQTQEGDLLCDFTVEAKGWSLNICVICRLAFFKIEVHVHCSLVARVIKLR